MNDIRRQLDQTVTIYQLPTTDYDSSTSSEEESDDEDAESQWLDAAEALEEVVPSSDRRSYHGSMYAAAWPTTLPPTVSSLS